MVRIDPDKITPLKSDAQSRIPIETRAESEAARPLIGRHGFPL